MLKSAKEPYAHIKVSIRNDTYWVCIEAPLTNCLAYLRDKSDDPLWTVSTAAPPSLSRSSSLACCIDLRYSTVSSFVLDGFLYSLKSERGMTAFQREILVA